MVTKRFQPEASLEWAESHWTRPTVPGVFAWFEAVPAKVAGPQSDGDKRWLLATGLATEETLRAYRPLIETPALFRTFADAEPTEAGFSSFVNQHGCLGTRRVAAIGNQVVTGDSLARFQAEHAALRQVIAVLDGLKGNRIGAIAGQIDHPIIERGRKTGRYADVRDACVNWLKVTINERLGGIDPEIGDIIATVLGADSIGKLRLRQKTRSLLGALWLQCARAAEDDQVFRRCKACGGWMLISPTLGKRRQAIYCSPTCKVRAFRMNNSRSRKWGRPLKRKRGSK